jgi:NADH-quinone oxidoreductase subunit H
VTETVRDLLDSYWVLLPVKVLAVLALFLVFPLLVGYMEHKVMAHMQARVGAGVSFG